MNPTTDWPSSDEEARLLAQIHTNTPTAREELAVRYLPLLMHCLTRAFPHAAADLRDDAADRALVGFLSSTDGFDPDRAGLGAYLRMAARRDLQNLLEQERRTRRGIPLISVDEPVDRRNQMRDDEPTWDHPALVAAIAVLSPEERVIWELLRDGVRSTTTFVTRLGISHLDAREQVSFVTRLKDRVKRRLTRALEGVQ